MLTLNQCTLSGNSATRNLIGGGGIFNYGALTLNQCTLSGNHSGADGGGIDNFGGTARSINAPFLEIMVRGTKAAAAFAT